MLSQTRPSRSLIYGTAMRSCSGQSGAHRRFGRDTGNFRLNANARAGIVACHVKSTFFPSLMHMSREARRELGCSKLIIAQFWGHLVCNVRNIAAACHTGCTANDHSQRRFVPCRLSLCSLSIVNTVRFRFGCTDFWEAAGRLRDHCRTSRLSTRRLSSNGISALQTTSSSTLAMHHSLHESEVQRLLPASRASSDWPDI